MGSKQANAIDALVAVKIRSYRKQLGLSQVELASKLGLTFQQIQKYEKGTNRVGAGRLFEIAEIFNVPIQAMYPTHAETVERAVLRPDEAQQIAEFAMGADGWRLCRAFLKISSVERRKKIIALAQELMDS